MSDWKVNVETVFVTQADVRVHVESAPVHIRGATGNSSSIVNGIFDPTEELSCGQPVYVKRGDGSKCIHFWSVTGQWIVAEMGVGFWPSNSIFTTVSKEWGNAVKALK